MEQGPLTMIEMQGKTITVDVTDLPDPDEADRQVHAEYPDITGSSMDDLGDHGLWKTYYRS